MREKTMYEKHQFEIAIFDENDSYVCADKSDGGSTGWNQFSVDPEKSDI